MIILRNSDISVIDYIGGWQKKMNYKYYRKNKYLIESKYSENEKVIYNAFTGCMVVLNPVEEQDMMFDTAYEHVQFLWENYFIVPEDFNEDELVDLYRERNKRVVTCNSLDRIYTYTIFTTTECNARCFYCYQNPRDPNKFGMTPETARKVVRFMVNTSNRELHINWFGGEPTYNLEAMDIIINGIKAAGRTVISHFTSNAYLMNDELCKKLKDVYNTDEIQVTLDGTEEVYNRTKKYIYKDDPSPFKTVINNIHSMCKYGLRPVIRLNCDVHNVDNLKLLVKYLDKEFKSPKERQYLTVYCHELFDFACKRDDEKNKKLFENMEELSNLLVSTGLNRDGSSIPGTIKTVHCMADDNQSVCISPKGDLGLCEHYESSKYYGHIDDISKKDFDVIREWRNFVSAAEICKDCPCRPACLKSNNCPDHNICNKYEKSYVLNRARKDLIVHYEKWKESDKQKRNESNKNNKAKNK